MRWLLLALGILVASNAAAQAIARTIELGDGMRVSLVSRGACVFPGSGACALWQATGLDIARMDALLTARTYARIPGTPRVLAAIPFANASTRAITRSAGILYTDDRGATWNGARWPSPNVAEAIAFSADASLGVAVGSSQGIWVTNDLGLSWIERSSTAGLRYTDVAVTGREVVIVDEAHVAWRTSDRGFSLDEMVGDVTGPLELEGDEIVIRTATRTLRVDGRGRVARD